MPSSKKVYNIQLDLKYGWSEGLLLPTLALQYDFWRKILRHIRESSH